MNLGELERETLSQSESAALKRLPNHSLSELLVPLSAAIDLAEGRTAGHAQKVGYIAMSLAAALELDPADRLNALYAGLFHDVGVIAAGSGLSEFTSGDERMIFSSMPLMPPEEAVLEGGSRRELVQRIEAHVIHGGRAAQELNLPQESVLAISAHHENWNGSGYPHGLSGHEIPLLGRIVALADHVEALIDQVSPLIARRNLPAWLSHLNGGISDPDVIGAFRALANTDTFWLGLFGHDLAREIQSLSLRQREPRTPRLMRFSESFARLIDSRFYFLDGISALVAELCVKFGYALSLPEPRVRQLEVAAHLHDIGQLAISERIMAKPAILSVQEMETLQQHPAHSRDIIASINGLEEVAGWVAAHHERLDGKGYPDGLGEAQIPVEARMMAIADAYVAMTSDRPHRAKVEPGEAKKRLRAAAGTQLDGDLLEVFLRKVV